MVSGFQSFSEAQKCGTRKNDIPVRALLGLCNPRSRGCGEPAKPGLLYSLVSIPCYDTVTEKPGSQSRVGSIASDLESWVT
jgi:hypothetical protein